jgi:hypothetical protein
MSEPSIGAVGASAPPPINEEPISTKASGNETLACVAPPSDGAEGASEPGARALVQRFGGSQGAGGTGEVPEEPKMPGDEPYCLDDAMRAIGTCGNATSITGIIGCVGAIDGYIECLTSERRAEKE